MIAPRSQGVKVIWIERLALFISAFLFPVVTLPWNEKATTAGNGWRERQTGKEDERCYLGALPELPTVDNVHLDARSLRFRSIVRLSPTFPYDEVDTQTPAATSRTTSHVRHVLGSWALGRAREIETTLFVPHSASLVAKRKNYASPSRCYLQPFPLPLLLTANQSNSQSTAHVQFNSTQYFPRGRASSKLQLPIRAPSRDRCPTTARLGTSFIRAFLELGVSYGRGSAICG